MNIYLHPSGVKKELKNDYIGKVYEYSYDFRNKTTTQVQNDGWFVYDNTSAYMDTRAWSVDSN
jgi:predicted membrane-bound spermidine synthase